MAGLYPGTPRAREPRAPDSIAAARPRAGDAGTPAAAGDAARPGTEREPVPARLVRQRPRRRERLQLESLTAGGGAPSSTAHHAALLNAAGAVIAAPRLTFTHPTRDAAGPC